MRERKGEDQSNRKYQELRETAEGLLDGTREIGPDMGGEEIRGLVHELSVHQIELELQNEELQRAQQALEVSRQRFADLYDLAPVGYLTLDGRAVIEEANLAAADLLGVARRVLPSTPFVLYVEEGARSAFLQCFRTAVGSETRANFLSSLRSKDGRTIAARLDTRTVREEPGPSVRVYMAITDITEHKELERRIATSEERLRLAAERYPAAFLILDSRGGIDFVNSFAAELLGRRQEELIGRKIGDLGSGVPSVYLELLERAVATASEQRTETRIELAGEARDYAVTFAPLLGEDRAIRQVVGVSYDVSAHKRVQEDLERAVNERTADLRKANLAMEAEIRERELIAQELIQKQSKLRSLSSELLTTGERERQRLAADLHDHIGQALAFTKINLGMLRESLRDEDLARQADHLLSVLDQIIGDTQSLIFDLSPPVLTLLGLGPALEWLAEKMQEEHGIRVVVSDDGKPKPLAQDLRVLLFQTVRELLTNVVKHSGSRTARVVVGRRRDNIRITVEDRGAGMSPTQPEIAKGFGLFSIRERLIDLTGTMKIESRPGLTRVTVEAPLNQP